MRALTPRSRRGPTASHQARATGTVYIFCGPGLASCRRPRLTSNVRRHRNPTMATFASFPIEGGCDCGTVRFRLATTPIFVHCCHCRWCQRETGASFALNAMYEADRVANLGAEPKIVDTPSESGLGQQIARCPVCRVAVWSHYAGSGPHTKFVRVGTLDNPDVLPPDVHIFTASKQPWVILPEGTPAFEEYYERESLWPPESLQRRQAILPLIQAYQATRRT